MREAGVKFSELEVIARHAYPDPVCRECGVTLTYGSRGHSNAQKKRGKPKWCGDAYYARRKHDCLDCRHFDEMGLQPPLDPML